MPPMRNGRCTPAAAGIFVGVSSGSGAEPVLVMADSQALPGATISVAVIRSPGARSFKIAASFTTYGIVMAGMKPGMSSCLTRISFESGLTASTCPWSS